MDRDVSGACHQARLLGGLQKGSCCCDWAPFDILTYFIFCLARLLSTRCSSGSGPRDVARQLRDQKMVIRGYRDKSVLHVLNR